jgi:hypothetical protein
LCLSLTLYTSNPTTSIAHQELAGYAYRVTANTTQAEFVQSQITPSNVQVVANEPAVQAVLDTKRMRLHVVFWSGGGPGISVKWGTNRSLTSVTVAVDSPCLLLLHQNSSSVVVTLSSTVASSVKVAVTGLGILSGKGCSSPSRHEAGRASTTFSFDALPTSDSLGRSASIACMQ